MAPVETAMVEHDRGLHPSRVLMTSTSHRYFLAEFCDPTCKHDTICKDVMHMSRLNPSFLLNKGSCLSAVCVQDHEHLLISHPRRKIQIWIFMACTIVSWWLQDLLKLVCSSGCGLLLQCWDPWMK